MNWKFWKKEPRKYGVVKKGDKVFIREYKHGELKNGKGLTRKEALGLVRKHAERKVD